MEYMSIMAAVIDTCTRCVDKIDIPAAICAFLVSKLA